MTMIGKKSLSIGRAGRDGSIGHFRHATLLFTALLLIVTNGCAGSEKVDLKDRCMKYPLHLMCRGSVMKRGVPKMRNLDMLFDDYMRSKVARTSELDEYPLRRYNPLNNLAKKEREVREGREDLYEYYQSAKQAKHTNRAKLLERLLRSDGIGSSGAGAGSAAGTGRNARDADNNPSRNQPPNINLDSFIPFLDEFEYK